MKKLSELKEDQFICVGNVDEGMILTKKEFVETGYVDTKMFKVTQNYASIDIDDILAMIETLQDDMYESWLEEITEDKNELLPTLDIINKFLSKYPSYSEEEQIENDLTGEVGENEFSDFTTYATTKQRIALL